MKFLFEDDTFSFEVPRTKGGHPHRMITHHREEW